MKKNIQPYYTSPVRQLLCLLLLPLTLSGCLFEEPEMTADGELGVDPTEVSVTADITLDMKLTELETAHPSCPHRYQRGCRLPSPFHCRSL